jgi:hypothetical protein
MPCVYVLRRKWKTGVSAGDWGGSSYLLFALLCNNKTDFLEGEESFWYK